MAVGFASDIDGTLLRVPSACVNRRDREAIERFQASGGIFGVNTGRNRYGMAHAMRCGPVPEFAVLCTGALVLGPGGEVLFERRLGVDATREILGRLVPRACIALVVCDRYYTTSRLVSSLGLIGPYAHAASIDDIDEPMYGLSLLLPTESAARIVADRIAGELSDVACCHLNRTVIDVVSAGCSKATGQHIVNRELGLHPVSAIGDSYNDLPMFAAADVSFTFHSSPAPVRDAATHTVSTVSEALGWVLARRA